MKLDLVDASFSPVKAAKPKQINNKVTTHLAGIKDKY